MKVGHVPIIIVSDEQLRRMAGDLTDQIRQQLKADAQRKKDSEARLAFSKEIGEMERRERDLPVLAKLREEVAGIGAKSDVGAADAAGKTAFSSVRAPFIAALPPPSITTDGEGRFTVPSQSKFWVIACAEQPTVVDKLEPLWTRLFDPLEKLPSGPIILSNDSVVDSSEELYGWLASLCDQPGELKLLVQVDVSPVLAEWIGAARTKAFAAITRREEARRRELRTVREGRGFALPDEDDTVNLVKRAVASRDEDAVRECFRLGDAQPSEVVDFMKSLEANEGHASHFSWLGNLDVSLEGVRVDFKDKSDKSARLALLVPDDSGLWKVDFGAFARASRPTWKELIGRTSERLQGRVWVQMDSYFNGPFQDENEWTCFAITVPEVVVLLPEDQRMLHGYCRKSSPQEKALKAILDGSKSGKRVTLELARKPEGGQRQFEITRVLAKDWVMSGSAYDEKFK